MSAFRISTLAGTAATLAFVILGASVPARAGIVYTSYTYDDDASVDVDFSTGKDNVAAGEFSFYDGSTDVANTWCVDIYHTIEGSGNFTETAPVELAGGSSNITNGNGAALSWQTLGEMGYLANYYDNHSGNFYKSSVQIAMWEIEYGTSIISSIFNSQYNGQSNAVKNQVSTLMGDVGTSTDWDFYWLTQSGNQGQLLMCGDATGFTCKNGDNPPGTVPEPGSLTLLGAGLFGFAGLGALRRRRRQTQAA